LHLIRHKKSGEGVKTGLPGLDFEIECNIHTTSTPLVAAEGSGCKSRAGSPLYSDLAEWCGGRAEGVFNGGYWCAPRVKSTLATQGPAKPLCRQSCPGWMKRDPEQVQSDCCWSLRELRLGAQSGLK